MAAPSTLAISVSNCSSDHENDESSDVGPDDEPCGQYRRTGAGPRDPRTAAAAQAEAIRMIDAAIAEKQAPEAPYCQLAELLAARNDSDRADALLLSVRDRFPQSIRAQTAAAGVYDRRGDFERTIEALRALVALQRLAASGTSGLSIKATERFGSERSQRGAVNSRSRVAEFFMDREYTYQFPFRPRSTRVPVPASINVEGTVLRK